MRLTEKVFVAIVGLYLAVSVLSLNGCTPSFQAAGCQRYSYPNWNIAVCNDNAVAVHCLNWIHRTGGKNDDGSEVVMGPRACWHKKVAGKKGVMWIGESYTKCIPHETCHAEGYPAEYCGKKYPCVGEQK